MNDQALKIAVKIIKNFEGCNLRSYPDPASKLYIALSAAGMLAKYLRGDIIWNDLPEHFQALSGAPWTVGYGQTGFAVNKDTVWTQQEADSALQAEVVKVMTQCLKDCSKLASKSPEGIAAITSLAFNIGNSAFKNSTACKLIQAGNHADVANAIKMWDKAKGKVMDGLVKRRKVEADLWNSVP